MKAMVVRELGPIENMQYTDLPSRDLEPGEVRIRVRGAGLNFPDILMIKGTYQHKPPLPFVPGMEGAGEVLEVGGAVRGIAPGDRVMMQRKGGLYAEESIVQAHQTVPLPPEWDFAEGAAFWSAYVTAYVSLVERGKLQRGET